MRNWRPRSASSRKKLQHIRISQDVSCVEIQRHTLQPQNHSACDEKYDLLSEIRRRRKWANMGQQLHRYENLLNRQFHADKPNRKWVTDISYIHTKQGILYLSMIRDLYDNSVVAYKTGTEQTVNLVLDTIRLAMRKEKRGPLRSCSSTATRAFNIHPKHISS